jgi:hypothetical protein
MGVQFNIFDSWVVHHEFSEHQLVVIGRQVLNLDSLRELHLLFELLFELIGLQLDHFLFELSLASPVDPDAVVEVALGLQG